MYFVVVDSVFVLRLPVRTFENFWRWS